MDPIIAIYRGTEPNPAFTLPLLEVARVGLARLFATAASRIELRHLLFFPVPEEDPLPGRPAVTNLNPDWGYVRVVLVLDRRYLYSHPHPVAELIAAPLQEILRESHTAESAWGFCVIAPGMPGRPTARPDPVVEGAIGVLPYDEDEAPPFRISPVPEPPLPVAALADFGAQEDNPARRAAAVKVLVPAPLVEDLTRGRPFSPDVEEGGFLVGRVWEDREHPGTVLVELKAAPPAEHTGASLLHFTFTGNSFDAVKRALREKFAGNRLIGWYHTHLFPATEAMGLSSIDLKLHFTTFRQPWQLAGLLNLEPTRRVLRFYVRQGNEMVECPQWVLP